jgi:hypothetical protein
MLLLGRSDATSGSRPAGLTILLYTSEECGIYSEGRYGNTDVEQIIRRPGPCSRRDTSQVSN